MSEEAQGALDELLRTIQGLKRKIEGLKRTAEEFGTLKKLCQKERWWWRAQCVVCGKPLQMSEYLPDGLTCGFESCRSQVVLAFRGATLGEVYTILRGGVEERLDLLCLVEDLREVLCGVAMDLGAEKGDYLQGLLRRVKLVLAK